MSDNEKFCYILQNRGYDVLYICISHVHKMFEARDIILSSNYRKRLSDTWWLLSMRLRTRLGHGQYLFLC